MADSSAAVDAVQRRRLRGAVAAPAGDAMISELSERGRGLLMVGGLSYGRCAVYPTTVCQTGGAGKAVGFALPGAGAAPTEN